MAKSGHLMQCGIMSAFGTKRTFYSARSTAAILPIADLVRKRSDVGSADRVKLPENNSSLSFANRQWAPWPSRK